MPTNNSINAPIGSIGQYLFNNGTSYQMLNPFQDVLFYDDFTCSDVQSILSWGIGTANSGTVTEQAALDNGHTGLISFNTNASTNAQASCLLGSNSGQDILLGGGRLITEFLIQLSALSDGTDTYTLYIGLGTAFNVEPTNGCYFRYTHGTNSGNWQVKTADNSTRTTGNTATAVAASTWTRLTIDVNADATSVSFYVNGTEVTGSPITTNIPTAAGRNCEPNIILLKSAGTNNRSLYLDLFWFYQHLTTSR
jgi:hypothetical protein